MLSIFSVLPANWKNLLHLRLVQIDNILQTVSIFPNSIFESHSNKVMMVIFILKTDREFRLGSRQLCEFIVNSVCCVMYTMYIILKCDNNCCKHIATSMCCYVCVCVDYDMHVFCLLRTQLSSTGAQDKFPVQDNKVYLILSYLVLCPVSQHSNTCKVLEDPITSLLLPVVWNDVMTSCLSGGFTHSSDRTQDTWSRQEVTLKKLFLFLL